jgi:hypothetical protein
MRVEKTWKDMLGSQIYYLGRRKREDENGGEG